MGLFDKLFEKKTCDICGNNLGPEANIPQGWSSLRQMRAKAFSFF